MADEKEKEENSLQERINKITQEIIMRSGVDGGYVQGIAVCAIIFEAAYIAAGEVVVQIGKEGMDLDAMRMEIAKTIVSQIQVVTPTQSMASPVLHPDSTGLPKSYVPQPVPNRRGGRRR